MTQRTQPSIQYVSHPIFSQPDAREQLDQLQPDACEDSSPVSQSAMETLCASPVFSRKAEHYWFLKMNHEKYRASLVAGKTRESHLAEALAIRNRIVRANLRLVVSIASRFATPSVNCDELISEGVLPLMRAVELFDVSRGWAFGTYATHVLQNHYRRAGKRRQRRNQMMGALKESQLAELPDEGVPVSRQQELAGRHARMVKRFLAELPQTDQIILRTRFGFDDPATPKLKSYSEVGQVVGLSKERVRVRTHRALEQLRETAEENRWEFPELFSHS